MRSVFVNWTGSIRSAKPDSDAGATPHWSGPFRQVQSSDELPELRRNVLEQLRQPLEAARVTQPKRIETGNSSKV